MNRRHEKNKRIPVGQIIALIIGLCALDVESLSIVLTFLLLFGPIVLVGYLIYRHTKKEVSSPRTRQTSFDECPQSLFCFHKDKGEHHVKRGKEMDPWDRPDIDISKYQRRQ